MDPRAQASADGLQKCIDVLFGNRPFNFVHVLPPPLL